MIDSKDSSYIISNEYSSKAQDFRIRHIILHYTALPLAESITALTGDSVSSHYLIADNPPCIDNKPVIYQLVPDNKRAWHAGISQWRRINNINYSSIGIELVNLGYTQEQDTKHWYPYPALQISALQSLMLDLIALYQINPVNIIGHADIAPGRKSDPGPLFPWKQLADNGIGAWPDPARVRDYLKHRQPNEALSDILAFQKNLARYGYAINPIGTLDQQTRAAVSAFQMHFRPSNYDGTPDQETAAILDALLCKYGPH